MDRDRLDDGGVRVEPLTGIFGAEVSGLDLSDGPDGAFVRELLVTHAVLVFRGQSLDRRAQVDLARSMGEPTPAHPVVPGDADFPEILELDAAAGGRNARWHTDVTFVPAPPACSILTADILPAYGGDTMWADLRAGYDRLASGLRTLVDGLDAVHRIAPLAYWGEPFDTALSRDDAEALYRRAAEVPPVIHPVVRVHPRSGRRALMVNPGFTTHIVGFSRIESDHLLRLLYEHITQPELTVRHRWAPGDVVMWDNQATAHYAVDDYGSVERRMRRVTLRGDRPVGVDGRQSTEATDPLIAIR